MAARRRRGCQRTTVARGAHVPTTTACASAVDTKLVHDQARLARPGHAPACMHATDVGMSLPSQPGRGPSARGRYALLRLPDTRMPTEPARPPMIVSECLRRAPGKPEAPTRSAPAPSSSDGAGLEGALSSGQRSVSARDEVVMYGLDA
jgi:hypothetical protein